MEFDISINNIELSNAHLDQVELLLKALKPTASLSMVEKQPSLQKRRGAHGYWTEGMKEYLISSANRHVPTKTILKELRRKFPNCIGHLRTKHQIHQKITNLRQTGRLIARRYRRRA